MSGHDTTLEARLGAALDSLAADEAPTSTVTVPGLLEAGRAQVGRRRNRRFGALGVALATAAVLTAGVMAGAGGRDGTGPEKGRPTPAATTTVLGVGADPDAPIVAFGWLPSGFDGESWMEQDLMGSNWATGIDPKTKQPSFDGPGVSSVSVRGPNSEELAVNLQGRGAGTEPGLSETPAGSVQGHPAVWVSATPGSARAAVLQQLTLMWQYAPDAWATIDAADMTSAAGGQLVLEVARHLEIGQAHPTAMPFRIPQLPAALHVDAAIVDRSRRTGPAVGSASMRLCVVSPCISGEEGLLIKEADSSYDGGLAAGLDFGITEGLPGGLPTTFEGHPAELWTRDVDVAAGATLTFDDGSAKVTISAAGKEYQALGGRTGFLAFCASIQWFGTDPAHWTTDVIG